jgi:hypothetical protein
MNLVKKIKGAKKLSVRGQKISEMDEKKCKGSSKSRVPKETKLKCKVLDTDSSILSETSNIMINLRERSNS